MHRYGSFTSAITLAVAAVTAVGAAALPVTLAWAAAGDAAPTTLDRLPSGLEARLLAEPLAGDLANTAPIDVDDLTGVDRAVVHPILSARPARLPLLSSAFGWRGRSAGSEFHAGIDIPGPIGTPVVASAAGVVGRAAWAGGYGLMIEVRHGGGFTTRYAHLSRLLVAPGAMVRQGQLLGLMGTTGRSTGSHLHFEVRQSGRPLDPIAVLRGTGLAMASLSDWPMPDISGTAAHVSDFARSRASAAGAGDGDQGVGGPQADSDR